MSSGHFHMHVIMEQKGNFHQGLKKNYLLHTYYTWMTFISDPNAFL